MDLPPPNEDGNELSRRYSCDTSSGSPPPPTNKESSTTSNKSQQAIATMRNLKVADIKNLVSKAVEVLGKSSGTQQLLLGSVSGWTAGYLTMKVGRPAAFGIGGSIILFQLAQQQHLIQTDWDKVKQKIEPTTNMYNSKVPNLKANISKYARTNTSFSAGFVGGFLIGLAS